MLKVKLSLQNCDLLVRISKDKVGIDIGYTLTKIAYLDDNELFMFCLPSNNVFHRIDKLLIQKELKSKIINITGGKGFIFNEKIKDKYNSKLINEFRANLQGIRFLYNLNKRKELPNSLIVTLGTGTSMVIAKETYEHVGGSALGGGFYMALIDLLFDMKDFNNSIKLAKEGNRYNVDLKVADIYSENDPRVSRLFREFTAASLGKISESEKYKREDILNSLICMIGENIGNIAIEKANLHNLDNIVFCGGFTENNIILQRTLRLLCKYNNLKSFFLKNSLFAGTIGLLFL